MHQPVFMSLSARLDRLRNAPYRVLFPIGGVLLAWGVLPWAAFGLGNASYPAAFHAIVQVEGFLTAFAMGFLFTFIPRRSATAAPSLVELGIAATFPLGIAVTTWLGIWSISQLLWVALLATIARFVLSRVLASPRAPRRDAGRVWIPLALAMGLVGAGLTGAAPILGDNAWWLHSVGKSMLTQGMFMALCIGVGRLLFPVMLHARPPVLTPRPLRQLVVHLALGLAFAASFFLEARVSAQWAWGTRAAITFALVVSALGGLRLPSAPGLHRWMLWVSGWMIPVGYASMALFPAQRLAGLHLVFIGGFSLMVIAVSYHVVLAHGGHSRLLNGRPWQLTAVGILVAIALIGRTLMVLQPIYLREWALLAATALIVGGGLWIELLIHRLDGVTRPPDALNLSSPGARA